MQHGGDHPAKEIEETQIGDDVESKTEVNWVNDLLIRVERERQAKGPSGHRLHLKEIIYMFCRKLYFYQHQDTSIPTQGL